MKLAEALQLRTGLQKRINQLSSRLCNNATVQEGEKPAEDPAALMEEYEDCVAQLEGLIARINRTNSETRTESGTLTELLARRVGELTGTPVEGVLEKVRATAVQSQAGEDGARQANVRGAYAAVPGLDLTGKRVALVDDVATSGATLSECAAALRRAGAECVVGLTLARAR